MYDILPVEIRPVHTCLVEFTMHLILVRGPPAPPMSMLTGRISDTLTCPPFVTRLSNIQSVACRRGHITVRILLSPHHGSMLTTPARPVDSSSKALENQHQKQLEQQVRHTPGILDDTTQPQKKRSKPKTRNPRRPPSPHAKTRNPRRPPTHPQKRRGVTNRLMGKGG